ncbi:esterase/lipase [Aliiruegeria haliotis]|uniref:Esterase/lipase n=1 Tax=Aliiruegeria haliotis TaxID=1280846 RepID=A0A2T0RWK2_9RHOB|nr:alpha/beta fold hydrolase [Aliiruegeria haliotis]PRY25538.1 esterase/lipase [Aliiruegeria haliotis]
MIEVLRVLGWILVVLILGIGAVLLFGPREPVETEVTFDAADLPEDLDSWLAEREAALGDVTPGVERRIHWAGAPGAVTPVSVIYLHGFSATSEEIRPVPDRVAEALGANLFYTRLSGHGRGSAAMAEPVVGDWIEDLAEALAIGRRIGERVVIVATSTGGTLASLAAVDEALSRDVAGIVFVSPNFGLRNPAAKLLSLPFVRHWGPVVAGAERGFEPRNEGHSTYWTTRYPIAATVPMAALVDHAASLDFGRARVPALFVYSEDDVIVSPEATFAVYDAWGEAKARELLVMGPGDDPGSHVIAGDIMSPGQTDRASAVITKWVQGL